MVSLDIYYITFLIAIIAVTAVITEFLSLKEYIDKEISRKILHLVAVGCTAVSFYVIENIFTLRIIAFAGAVFTFMSVKFNLFVSIDKLERKSWGIFLFALAYFVFSMILPDKKNIAFVSLAILALSDSGAAIIGTLFPRGIYNLTRDKKSLSGSVTFFIVTFLILLISIRFSIISFNQSILINFLAILSISLVLTLTEAISSYGFDNFYVPIISAILLFLFGADNSGAIILNFSIGILLSAIVAAFSYKVRFLTLSGSVATFLLAGFIFGFGSWQWSIPIMTFFILSSILSKIRKNKNREVELYFEKTGVRDHWQVAANGGIGGILVIISQFFPDYQLIYILYIASLATVCADTWATEIGTLKQANTYSVINFKKVEQGISGGISVVGTFGAFLGTIVIAISGIFWIAKDHSIYILFVVLSGLIGAFIDSILGATLQLQYKCDVCGKITEKKYHCDKPSKYFKGLSWLENDLVNLLSAISGIIIIILLYGFYG